MPLLSGTQQAEDEMIEVEMELASANEQFLCDWGRESLKAAVPGLNDMLNRLAVLNGVLIGGAVLWVEKGLMPTWARAAFVFCLIFSLTFAVFGAYPKGRIVNVNDPDDVWEFEKSSLERKKAALWWTGFALLAGCITALVGIVVSATT